MAKRSAINDKFDKVIFINSKNRPDRHRNIVKRLAELNIEAERFNAIFGGHLDQSKINFGAKVHVMNNAEIGCFLSHVEVYKLIKANGWRRTLRLEDDAEFSKAVFPDRFEALYNSVPEDWQMLYFGQFNYDHLKNGGNIQGGPTYALQKEVAPGVYKANRCWLTHAYAVDISCIDHLIENTKVLWSSIDHVLADIQEPLRVYAIHPAVIKQDATKSSLR